MFSGDSKIIRHYLNPFFKEQGIPAAQDVAQGICRSTLVSFGKWINSFMMD